MYRIMIDEKALEKYAVSQFLFKNEHKHTWESFELRDDKIRVCKDIIRTPEINEIIEREKQSLKEANPQLI